MFTVLILLSAGLAGTLVAAAAVGSVRIDWMRAFDFSRVDNPDFTILFRTRLPRVFLGAAVGGGLAAAGVALQALLRNSLASPDVIGVSGGASVGAIAVLALGADRWITLPGAAFLGSLGAIALIVRLSTVHGRLHPYSLLLVGVIVNTIAAALVMLVSSLVESAQAQGALFWLSGSLSQRDVALVFAVFGIVLAATGLLWAQGRSLNLLALGEETAAQLGTDVSAVRWKTFLASALLVGTAVSVSGIIGFVGLIVPHGLRLILGSDHRLLVPASFFGGAMFLIWADMVARVAVAPTEIPVGVVTALCGGPFFLFLLRQQERARSL